MPPIKKVRRPTNHVTRKRDMASAVAENKALAGVDGWPYIPPSLVDFLEKQFPARCIKEGEDFRAHERYAGKVDLVAAMRAHVSQYANFGVEEVMTGDDLVAQINAGLSGE